MNELQDTEDPASWAKAQAAEDAEVWAKLEQERIDRLVARADKARKAEHITVEGAEGQESVVIETDNPDTIAEFKRVPMNRAQRRAQVQQYASLLAMTERQTPVVNPTIRPKSKRRRQPGQKGRLQHAAS